MNQPPSPGEVLSYSPSSEKRRYLRYEVVDFAKVSTRDATTAFHAVVTDIGLGGLQLRARQWLESGIRVTVEVGRTDLPPLCLMGEVSHCSVLPESDLCGVGVRFTPHNHEERMAIVEYVHGVFQRQCDLLSS